MADTTPGLSKYSARIMIAPIDDRIRTFHKGILRATDFSGASTSQDVLGHEDPTYLGFTLGFDFDPISDNIETGQQDNPLFAEPGQGINSAQEYLMNIGFNQRAKGLKEFKELLRYMNKNAPYFFQGVSGVAELWKIEKNPTSFEPNRGFEKVLKFDCLESIDLRMTAFADLYRNASFDARYMRELLPENLRWFTMTLRVAEIRSFHSLSKFAKASNPDLPIEQNPTGDLLKIMDDVISVVEFKLSHCQFDFEESFADEFSMGGDNEMAKQSFKIQVGSIEQKSTYKLLDIALSDFYTSSNEGIGEKSDVIGGKFSGTSQQGENARPVLDEVPLGSRVPGMDNTVNPNNLFNGAVSVLQDKAKGFSNELGSLGGNLIGNALGRLQSKITGQSLGNVYGPTNNTILSAINGFLGGGDTIKPAALGDVYPNVPGEDTTTKLATDLGNTYSNTGTGGTGIIAGFESRDLGNVYD